MPKEGHFQDPVLPIPFLSALTRAIALCGISVDDVLVSEQIDLDKLPGVPISKIAIIVKSFLARSPLTTIFPILKVLNDNGMAEMLTISTTAKTLTSGTHYLMKHGPFAYLGIQLYYETNDYQDCYLIQAKQAESLSRTLMIELCAALFVRSLPAQFQETWPILCVQFDFIPTGDVADYEKFFGCRVLFNQDANRIHISKGLAEREIKSYSPNLLAQAIEALQEKTDLLLSLQGVRFQVSLLVQRLVTEKIKSVANDQTPEYELDLSIETVANILGLNVRSLQRKLKQEGGSFLRSKNQVLINESKNWMDQGQRNLDLIAETLCFSDRASFSKVFNKYEGVWPAQYKQRKYIG